MTANPNMQVPQIAYDLTDELAKIDGVIAVVLGGSWAKGTATKDSDIDLAIYYEATKPPSLESLREVANLFDDNPSDDILTNFGDWGPWINGGGWMSVKGQRVDLLYSNLEQIRHHVNEAPEGRSTLYKQPGHPHGFNTHMYAGQIHIAKVLYDPTSEIAKLKQMLEPYPPKLKAFLIQEFLWQAEFALNIAKKAVSRADVYYVTACFVECAACLIQVLFALNETYWINEKGAVAITDGFKSKPNGFRETLEQVLAHPGASPRELEGSLKRFKHLVNQTQTIVEELPKGNSHAT
jgi:predicted nucleotidyltransferase